MPIKPPTESIPSPLVPSTPSTPSAPGDLVISPEAAAEMLFNTMVIYGPTGTRKTSQIGEFAKYIYAKTGKKTRLLSADGGGWGPIQDLVNAGIIEPWRIATEAHMPSVIMAASRGAWPKTLVNGLRKSGPVYVPSAGDVSKALSDVGAYAVEGWLSIATALMANVVDKGRKINEDVVSKWTENTEFGEFSFGAPSRGHYGYAQKTILDMIRNFSGLPLERILYTSLEARGEDKISKETVFGPAVAGKAITSTIPQFVGDCLHFEDFTVEAGTDPNNPKQKLVQPEVRAWFIQHPDSYTGNFWPAKARLIPSKVEEFKKRMGPHGYFILGTGQNQHGLYDYLTTQDELLSSSTDAAKKWKEEIDALRAKNQSLNG